MCLEVPLSSRNPRYSQNPCHQQLDQLSIHIYSKNGPKHNFGHIFKFQQLRSETDIECAWIYRSPLAQCTHGIARICATNTWTSYPSISVLKMAQKTVLAFYLNCNSCNVRQI